jgi:hypothetical protein
MAQPLRPGTRYRVYFTPLTAANTYGSEIEVTDHIVFNGIKVIKRAIDSQDYEVGVYFYSDLDLQASNDNGYFNEDDLRSIFPFFRDKTKVRVVFENTVGTSIVYYGLINEEATRIDALNETIDFRVLSRDSVIRNTQIVAGTVAGGTDAKTAIFNILSNPVITSVLGVDLANINPSTNFTIDSGTPFDNKQTNEALNLLLLASNSILLLDADGNVTVQSRAANGTAAALNLYGPYDIKNRQNVINIQNYNNGLHRMYTSLAINDGNGSTTILDNSALVSTYGYRQFTVDFEFLTDQGTINTVGAALLAEFAVPKVEFEIEVPTSVARSVDLLDRVSVDWPLRVTPYASGDRMPVVGVSKIDDAVTPLPRTVGSLVVNPAMAFKIIEIDEDPQNFTTLLKLRQIGTTLSDGWFTTPDSSIVGFAIVGLAPIDGEGNTDDQWNPSVVGAALSGSTRIA